MEKTRDEIIEELKSRLEYFSDERLKLLHKSSKPITQEDIKADIVRHSKSLR